MSNQDKNVYLIPLAIIISGILLAGVMLYSNRNTSPKNSTTTLNDNIPSQVSAPPGASAINIKNVRTAGEAFIGKANAPVVLAYWFDFQCPFCKRFETNTLPILVNKYVKTGKLKIVFKNFQFLGPDSRIAGVIGRAIWELYPSKYFQWHQAMYVKQDEENSGWGNRADILKLAATIPGINAKQVSQLITQKQAQFQREDEADKSEGARFKINGTPGFVIGTQSIYGAQPTSVFTQIINSELNQVK